MADTTTAILGLTKVGAPSTNSWGGKWNTNFDTIDALFELNGGEPVLKQAKGGTGAKTAAAARTNLGATTVGDALFTAADATEACAEFEAASPARFAIIEQSTDSGETDYEIGAWIFCSVAAGAPDLNSVVVPKISITNNFSTTGTGATLAQPLNTKAQSHPLPIPMRRSVVFLFFIFSPILKSY